MNFLLHFLAQVVVHRTLTELSNGTAFCPNPIPGVDRIVRGIDITLLDLRHDYSVDHVDGFKQKILSLTCTEGKIWTSPFDSQQYNVPDQVNEVSALPAGLLYSQTLLETNMEELRNSMGAEAGIDVLKGFFSASLSYKTSEGIFTNSSRFLTSSKAFVSTTEIDFIPSQFLQISINRYLKFALDQLPDSYEANPAVFQQFISNYGTHYYTSGYFGGSLTTSFDIANAYRRATSDEEVKANAEASFFGILKAHGAYDGEVHTVSEAFKEAAHLSQRFYGGVANLFDKDGYSKWWPTVFRNPWLYGGKLVPITDILNTGSNKAALETAVQVYVLKTYLKEISRIASSFMHKGYVVGDSVMPTFLNLANVYAQKIIPTVQEVESLGNTLTDFVFTPDWFSKETTYCVRWVNPLIGTEYNQCAKMLDRMPNFYHCGPLGQGCYHEAYFTFGLAQSPNAPPWWANVTAEGSFRGPDRTSNFRFNVPLSSPLWLQNSQLCFYRDDVPLCALANQWTPRFDYHAFMNGGLKFIPFN